MRVLRRIATMACLVAASGLGASGCASDGKHTVVPGPPMLAGGRMIPLDPSCHARMDNGWAGATRVVGSQVELGQMIQCSTPATGEDPTKVPAMREGRVFVLFEMDNYGSAPQLIGLEHSEGRVTGIFSGAQYCGGPPPPTMIGIALVELDAPPKEVRSTLRMEPGHECSMLLP